MSERTAIPISPWPEKKKPDTDWSKFPGMDKVKAERDALEVCLKTAAHDEGCGCASCSRNLPCPHCRRVGCQNPQHVEGVKASCP